MAGLRRVERPLRRGHHRRGGRPRGLVDEQPAVHRAAARAPGHRRRQAVEVAAHGGRVEQRAGAVHRVEAAVGLEGELGRELQVDARRHQPADLGAVAAERLDHELGVHPAERQHEDGGVAQVGRDPRLRHGDRGLRQLGVVHLAARQDLRQRPADQLAHAQLALAAAAGDRSCLCHARHFLSGRGEVKAGGGAHGRAGRDRGARGVGAHGADAGARGRGDAGRAALRRHRAAGPSLDRARPRRGHGRGGARRHRRGRPARGLRPEPGGARLHRPGGDRRPRRAGGAGAADACHRHHRARAGGPREARRRGAARGHRAGGQHERGGEPLDGAGAAGGGGARAGLRHRDRRDAPPRQGRRALGDGADVRGGGGGRAAGQPRRRRRARPRRGDGGAGGRARSASRACAAATWWGSTR